MLGQFHKAIQSGEIEAVENFLSSSSTLINAQNENGQTALHLAADNVEMTSLLLAHGAKVDIEDHDGHTALVDAIIYRNIHTLKQLLKAGANPLGGKHTRDHALNIATDLNWAAGIQALLDHGANINAKGYMGLTALETAKFRNEKEALNILVARSAKEPKEAITIGCIWNHIFHPNSELRAHKNGKGGANQQELNSH
jgi:ankyrin repeat protein